MKLWRCDNTECPEREEPVSTRPDEDYDVGDWEPCGHCDSVARVVEVTSCTACGGRGYEP